MATNDVQRQQLIRAAVEKRTGEAAYVAIELWPPLASELVSIIGTGGFNSLYARSLYLTNASFPWLGSGNGSRSFTEFRLADLKNSLAGQSAVEAGKASFFLLLTFTDILASLIGESLTDTVLSSAWGLDAPQTDDADQEFPDE